MAKSPQPSPTKYDLIVIGTGPAGEKAAVKAAYFGHRVAIVDKQKPYGGAAVVTGTLPSKTMKETALYFSGIYEKGLYGTEKALQGDTSLAKFMYRKNIVTTDAALAVESNLCQHMVDRYDGIASFLDPHTINIRTKKDNKTISGEHIIIATGSYPSHPPEIPFDGKLVHDSDTILNIDTFPQSICILGAGVIGCEYATIFSTMGTKVHLINYVHRILKFIDFEVSEELVRDIERSGVNIHFNTTTQSVEPQPEKNNVKICLKNGEIIESDLFLYAAGRQGQTQQLNCEKINLEMGPRQTIVVDKMYRTNIPHIYAVGDVIGFPALASTSMDQGRLAVAHIYKMEDLEFLSDLFPFGIYTIPEVSTVGLSEEDAQSQGVSYNVGKIRYKDIPRGKILGVEGNGFLKLVFEAKTQRIRGVHIIGPMATELIHFGLLLIEDKKTLNHIIRIVFNFPTLHELYKYAAYDGLSNLRGYKLKK